MLITEALIADLHGAPEDYWRFTPFSLRRLLEESGFTILTVERIGGYWTVREQMRARYWITKYDFYDRSWGRLASFVLKYLAHRAKRRDKRDNTAETIGCMNDVLVVAEKHRFPRQPQAGNSSTT
jgi:hypothetical protein